MVENFENILPEDENKEIFDEDIAKKEINPAIKNILFPEEVSTEEEEIIDEVNKAIENSQAKLKAQCDKTGRLKSKNKQKDELE